MLYNIGPMAFRSGAAHIFQIVCWTHGDDPTSIIWNHLCSLPLVRTAAMESPGATGTTPTLDERGSDGARRYSLEKGIPRSALLVESQSKDTAQNLAGAQRLMSSAGLRTAVIVSDPYHLRRAGMLARRLHLPHVCSPTQTSRYSGFFARAKQLASETYHVTKLIF